MPVCLAAGFDPRMDGNAVKLLAPGAKLVAGYFRTPSRHRTGDLLFRRRRRSASGGGFQSELRVCQLACAQITAAGRELSPAWSASTTAMCLMRFRASDMQYVDLFPDWHAGVARLLEAIYRQIRVPRVA